MVISDRIVVMNKGRIEQIGDPITIYQHPVSSFTADFIGQANILEGRPVSVTAAECVLETPVGVLVSSNQPAQPADSLTISWRPEDLVPYASDVRNRLEGKILRAIFMGNLTNLFVDVNGTVLVAQASGARAWQAGEPIVLGLSPDKIQILR
jgi:ABC-type Fe3+/spermidine/putrescine transport system ATPase subunit